MSPNFYRVSGLARNLLAARYALLICRIDYDFVVRVAIGKNRNEFSLLLAPWCFVCFETRSACSFSFSFCSIHLPASQTKYIRPSLNVFWWTTVATSNSLPLAEQRCIDPNLSTAAPNQRHLVGQYMRRARDTAHCLHSAINSCQLVTYVSSQFFRRINRVH
jgi:hypothetical protein